MPGPDGGPGLPQAYVLGFDTKGLGRAIIANDEEFGAHRMHVNAGGHSGYWDAGSVSLENPGAVVVGKYGDVKEDN